MDAIAGLSFREAQLLLWLVAAALALAFLIARERRRREMADHLVSEATRGISNRLRIARPYFLGIGIALAIVALAGPRAGFTRMHVAQEARQRIVVLDVSQSMDAVDVGTSRLSAGKAIARRLLTTPGVTRAGLVVFEGKAVPVAPLTTDSDALVTLLESLRSGETEEPGSDIGAGVQAALDLLGTSLAASSDIVLISDGEDQGKSLDASIAAAEAKKVKVSAVLVGGTEPVTIPTESGPLTTEDGETVRTTPDPSTLQRIVRATGGVFLANPSATEAEKKIAPGQTGSQRSGGEVDVPIERFQWPLTAAVFLLLLGGIANRGSD